MDILDCPFGSVSLARWPVRKNDTLRAWDAADELLLQHVHESQYLQSPGSHREPSASALRILLVNDAFGALACALTAACDPTEIVSWSDSVVAHRAASHNLQLNRMDTALQCVASTDTPGGSFNLVLLKTPKTLALLEYQLRALPPLLSAHANVVAGGMVKHMPKSVFACFESNLGPVTTSRATKKARLLFAGVDRGLEPAHKPYPTSYTDDELQLTLVNHANVFSRDHLDIGARFFIDQFATLPAVESVVDLACGNGVLGIQYKRQHPGADVTYIDESYMAIASAAENHAALVGSPARFFVANGMENIDNNSIELVLCNPPFHQQHSISEAVAHSFFHDAKRCLQQHGELWLVANHHLRYQSALQRLFGNCSRVAANGKFVVLRSVRR